MTTFVDLYAAIKKGHSDKVACILTSQDGASDQDFFCLLLNQIENSGAAVAESRKESAGSDNLNPKSKGVEQNDLELPEFSPDDNQEQTVSTSSGDNSFNEASITTVQTERIAPESLDQEHVTLTNVTDSSNSESESRSANLDSEIVPINVGPDSVEPPRIQLSILSQAALELSHAYKEADGESTLKVKRYEKIFETLLDKIRVRSAEQQKQDLILNQNQVQVDSTGDVQNLWSNILNHQDSDTGFTAAMHLIGCSGGLVHFAMLKKLLNFEDVDLSLVCMEKGETILHKAIWIDIAMAAQCANKDDTDASPHEAGSQSQTVTEILLRSCQDGDSHASNSVACDSGSRGGGRSLVKSASKLLTGIVSRKRSASIGVNQSRKTSAVNQKQPSTSSKKISTVTATSNESQSNGNVISDSIPTTRTQTVKRKSLTHALNQLDRQSGDTPLTQAIRQRATISSVAVELNHNENISISSTIESVQYNQQIEILNKVIGSIANFPDFDPNVISRLDGNPALSVAVTKGGLLREKIVEMLLQHPKIDLDIEGQKKQTPFFSALQIGNAAVVEHFLQSFEKKQKNIQNLGLNHASNNARINSKGQADKSKQFGKTECESKSLAVSDGLIRYACSRFESGPKNENGDLDLRNNGSFLREVIFQDLIIKVKQSQYYQQDFSNNSKADSSKTIVKGQYSKQQCNGPDPSNAYTRNALHFFVQEIFNRIAYECSMSLNLKPDLLPALIRVRWGDFYEDKNIYLPGKIGFFSPISQLADFHYGDSDATVLHNLCTKNAPQNKTILRSLLRHDFAISMLETRDKNGSQPLHLACEYLKSDLLRVFLKDIRSAHERTIAEQEEKQKLKENATTEDAKLSETIAISTNCIPPLSQILNSQDGEGKTPLFCCLSSTVPSLNVDILLQEFGSEIRRSIPLYTKPRLSPWLYVKKNMPSDRILLNLLKPCDDFKVVCQNMDSVINGDIDEEKFFSLSSFSLGGFLEFTFQKQDANLRFDCFYDLIHDLPLTNSDSLVVREQESLLLWNRGIKPLLDLCGTQECVGMKKELLHRLLEQTKGHEARSYYRNEFDQVIQKNFSKLTNELTKLHEELHGLADERISPKDAIYFPLKHNCCNDPATARQASLELLYGVPIEQYYNVPTGPYDSESNLSGAKSQLNNKRRISLGSLTRKKSSTKITSINSQMITTVQTTNSSGIPVSDSETTRIDNFCTSCLNIQTPSDCDHGIQGQNHVQDSLQISNSKSDSESLELTASPKTQTQEPNYSLSDFYIYQLLFHNAKVVSDFQELFSFFWNASKTDKSFREDPRQSMYAAILTHFSHKADNPFSEAIRSKLVSDKFNHMDNKESIQSDQHSLQKSLSQSQSGAKLELQPFLSADQFKLAPVKKSERIREKGKEYRLEKKDESVFAGVQHVIDTFRCSFTLNHPYEMMRAIKILRSLRLEKDGLQLYRLKNMHSKKLKCEQTSGGYRDVKANILFKWYDNVKSEAASLSSNYDSNNLKKKQIAIKREIRMIGEVILILNPILNVKKHMHLLYKCQRGDY